MQIRHADTTDLPEILGIYDYARAFMRKSGNMVQWTGGFPQKSLLESDIAQKKLYVCVSEGQIACVFYFAIEEDPTYQTIWGGSWLDEGPYGVIHRIAAAPHTTGAATFCLQWGLSQCGSLRIDTHKDNVPMRSLLKKRGFSYCGEIRLPDGSPRLAFQKCADR